MNFQDVVVVGGGLAGLVAAVRAAELGLRVVVLERQTDERYLCNTRISSGVFHFCVTAPRTDPEALASKAQAVLDPCVDPELVRTIAGDVSRSITWLQQQGARFVSRNDLAWPHHTHLLAPVAPMQLGRQWEGRAGDVLLRTLEARLRQLGGELRRGHAVANLVIEDGRCAGVTGTQVVENRPFSMQAPAVVLADGGFQSNPEALKAWISPCPERLLQRNAGTGIGAGLAMAVRAGAATSDLAGLYGHLHSRDALTNDALWPYPTLDEVACRYMLVDASGKRVVDEGRGGIHAAAAIARTADPAGVTIICDKNGWENKGSAASSGYLPVNPMLVKGGGTVIRAATIRELAVKAGIDPDGLEAEVDRYNAALANGTLAGLNPSRSIASYPALPIAAAPFVALPAVAGITYTMGGPLIDKNSRVKRQEGGEIPGLYAAGSTSGGLEGYASNGYAGGLVKATVTALRAAEHIAAVRADC
jgi:fumarate reductase flavoprotein subunit